MARKMKDSGIEWIGEIPEGWEVVQLKRFAEVHNGREIDVEVDSTDSSAVGVYGSGGVLNTPIVHNTVEKLFFLGEKELSASPCMLKDNYGQ